MDWAIIFIEIDYLSRLIMISSVLIIGFKLNNVTIAISALIVGVILQTIYRKMKKDGNFKQEEF
jgi:Na+/glutamate symporter